MPAPARFVRPWLNGLVAGLLLVATLVAPAQHERMLLGRAVAALAATSPQGAAVAHHMHARHGDPADRGAPAGDGHDHIGAPACFACLLMGAPGLPAAAFAGLAARVLPAPAPVVARRPFLVAALAWAPHRPRGPPASLPI